MKNRFNSLLTTLLVLFLPALAIAQEAEHQAHSANESGLPMVVYLQAINFILYAGLLVYFLRKPVREYFTGRGAAFNAALTKAAAAKAEAEARKREVQAKIMALQANAAEDLAQAKLDALALELRILKEAEEISAHLRAEAARTATFEVERAKNELRDDLLKQSVAFSTKLLKEKIADGDQKRLQTEFIDKIGANQ